MQSEIIVYYPNNYLSFNEFFITVIELRHVRQTKANDHLIDEHEDSFIINLADDSSTDDPVMNTTALQKRPVKENEMTFFRCSVNCFLCIIE